MQPLLYLFIALLAAGLFFILADVLHLPTFRTAKAMLIAGKENKKTAKTLEAWLMSGAVKVSKCIHMDEYTHSRMTNVLKAAGISMTPEVSPTQLQKPAENPGVFLCDAAVLPAHL